MRTTEWPHSALDGSGIKKVLARDDLAAFMVEQVHSAAWVHKSPLIGY